MSDSPSNMTAIRVAATDHGASAQVPGAVTTVVPA